MTKDLRPYTTGIQDARTDLNAFLGSKRVGRVVYRDGRLRPSGYEKLLEMYFQTKGLPGNMRLSVGVAEETAYALIQSLERSSLGKPTYALQRDRFFENDSKNPRREELRAKSKIPGTPAAVMKKVEAVKKGATLREVIDLLLPEKV